LTITKEGKRVRDKGKGEREKEELFLNISTDFK
jgi:hypothetical protein